MNRISAGILFLFTLSLTAWGQINYADYFEYKSLRIDFALAGDAGSQSAAIIQLHQEPVWGGPVKNLIDPFNYGGYFVEMRDKASGRLIYSRGLNTLFEEWRSTEQAFTERQSWSNSIAVPFPKEKVVFTLMARNKQQVFESLLAIEIDPVSIFIDRSGKEQSEPVSILYNGDSHDKVDLVFLGEGYKTDEQEKFISDTRRFTGYLFNTAPFDSRKEDFNVWAVYRESTDSGTDIPGEQIYLNTAFNSGFYTFGVDRYLTTKDMIAVRDAVWNVPCDAIFILVNTDRYGGGGMYNLYAIGTADNPRTPEVFVHELGHSLAGLADEYFSSEVAYSDYYDISYEPWEPNITTLVGFENKWMDLLTPGTPIPTPLTSLYMDKPGVYEGAGYVSKDIYRPMDHCMMRDYAPFCPVCTQSILKMIDFLTDKERLRSRISAAGLRWHSLCSFCRGL